VTATEALLAVSALHAGFQLVVTVVVYPALAEVRGPSWGPAHAAHGRRITRLVAPLYAAVAAVCVWVLVAEPPAVATGTALAGHALAAGTTALVAAPMHGRLGRDGPQPALLPRLLVADRVRTAGAVTALLAAAAAASG
jgi:hypothetical protein